MKTQFFGKYSNFIPFEILPSDEKTVTILCLVNICDATNASTAL